jgi:hypothetical protein
MGHIPMIINTAAGECARYGLIVRV